MSLEHNPGRVEQAVNKLAEMMPAANRLVQRFRVVDYLNATVYTGLAGGAWATYFIQKGEYLFATPGIVIPLVVHGLTGIRYCLERMDIEGQINDLEYEKIQLECRIRKIEPHNTEETPN